MVDRLGDLVREMKTLCSNLGLFEDLLEFSTQLNATDVHIAPGELVRFRIEGKLSTEPLPQEFPTRKVTNQQTTSLASALIAQEELDELHSKGAVDGAFSLKGKHRFRFNAYKRSGELCFAFRRLNDTIPQLEELGLDNRLYESVDRKDGLILVAGPTGSGKSTTLASLVQWINRNRSKHIITLEDPVEYIHPSQMSLVNQRQIGKDVDSFSKALRHALRQDPDVILVGELRERETIQMAIQAGLTGHLVLGSIHAGDCRAVVERLVSSFPDEQGAQLVNGSLVSVVVQHLMPRSPNPTDPARETNRRVLASEILHVNPAVANLIRKADYGQLASIMETGREEGMWTLDYSLGRLWRSHQISEKAARSLARNQNMLSQWFQQAGRLM